MLFVPALWFHLFVLLIRPHEILPDLQALSPLYLALFLSSTTLIIDYQTGRAQRPLIPQLRLAWALFFWAMLTVLVMTPGNFVPRFIQFANTLILFLLVGYGVQGFRGIERVTFFILALMVFLAWLGVDQGNAPMGCFIRDPENPNGLGTPDGHDCETVLDCLKHGDPFALYGCEHMGMLGTSSVAGRVRYRGVLEDPNELSLATNVTLPFAFAFFQRKKSFFRLLMLLGSIALVAVCTVYSKSRGGQIIFLVVIGTYGLRIFGLARGLAFSSLLVVPMLMLGGRDSEDAEASSLERLGCWKTGVVLMKSHPFFGVGMGQFTEYHFLTAHNTYVLVAAELGVLGLLLFNVLIYHSVKIPVAALRALGENDSEEARVARIWSVAMLASMAGMAAGIFFLSLAYHVVVWVFLGLSAALANAVREVVPDFDPKVTGREVAAIFVAGLAVMAVIFVYATRKGA